MLQDFLLYTVGFGLLYAIILTATFPFLIFFGKPKPWQKVVQFLMSFPLDNERMGFFSLGSAVAFVFLNGLIAGIGVVGAACLACQLLTSIKSFI